MIRPYNEADFSSLHRIAEQTGAYLRPWLTAGKEDLRAELTDAPLILVSEQQEINAFVYADKPGSNPDGQQINFWIFVDPAYADKGIEAALWKSVEEYINGVKPYKVSTSFPTDWINQENLFSAAGFVHNFDSPRMEYEGAAFPEPKLAVKPYTDSYFSDYLHICNAGFYEIRRSIDAQPYLLYDEKSFSDPELRMKLMKNSKGVHLFFDQNELVGFLKLNGFIDELVVNPEHWGKGYGRALTHYGVNRLLEKGIKPALFLVHTNVAAKSLYESVGFQIRTVSRIMTKIYPKNKRSSH